MVCPSYWSLLAKWGVQDLNTHTFTTPLSTFLCTFSYHYTVVTFNATAPLFYSASLSLSSFVFPWETFLLNLYWYMYTVYKRYRLIQCTHDYSHTIVYIQTKIMKIQVNVIIWQLPMSTLDGFQNIFKRHYNKQQQLDTYHRKLHSTIYRLCMHLHSATEGLLCNAKPYKDYNFKTWLSSVV